MNILYTTADHASLMPQGRANALLRNDLACVKYSLSLTNSADQSSEQRRGMCEKKQIANVPNINTTICLWLWIHWSACIALWWFHIALTVNCIQPHIKTGHLWPKLLTTDVLADECLWERVCRCEHKHLLNDNHPELFPTDKNCTQGQVNSKLL